SVFHYVNALKNIVVTKVYVRNAEVHGRFKYKFWLLKGPGYYFLPSEYRLPRREGRFTMFGSLDFLFENQ
ncbi:hypothetical protein L9F63_009848, partial [Diploptera punctata]